MKNKNILILEKLFNFLSQSDEDINEVKNDLLGEGISSDKTIFRNTNRIKDLIIAEQIKASEDKVKIIQLITRLHKELFTDNTKKIKVEFESFIKSIEFQNKEIYAVNNLNTENTNEVLDFFNYETLCKLLDSYLNLKYKK